MKNICKKTILISIILLLIGVSVPSAISIGIKSTIINKQNENCKSCREVSRSDLLKVERLLDRVDVYSKLFLVLSRFNPELKEICEELSKEITKLRTLDLKEEICDWLEDMWGYLLIWGAHYIDLAMEYYGQGRIILAGLYFSIGLMSVSLEILRQDIYSFLDCGSIK